MLRQMIPIMIAIVLLATHSDHAAAQGKPPSQQDVQGIKDVCGGGISQKVAGDVNAKLELWRQRGQANGSASLSDLAGVLSIIPTNSDINPEVYKIYTSCVLQMTDQYLKSHSSITRADRLVAALDLGYDLEVHLGFLLRVNDPQSMIVGGPGLGDGRPFLTGEIARVSEDLQRLGSVGITAVGERANSKLYFRLADAAQKALMQDDLRVAFNVGRTIVPLCQNAQGMLSPPALNQVALQPTANLLNSLDLSQSALRVLNSKGAGALDCPIIMAGIKGEIRHVYSTI